MPSGRTPEIMSARRVESNGPENDAGAARHVGLAAPAGYRMPETGSGVVVECELVRMRAEPHRVDLVGRLVLDPGLDDVLGEDVALQQELVVVLQVVDG